MLPNFTNTLNAYFVLQLGQYLHEKKNKKNIYNFIGYLYLSSLFASLYFFQFNIIFVN